MLCAARQLRGLTDDAFPQQAGVGALPVMAWDDQAFRRTPQQVATNAAAADGGFGAPGPPRTLAPQPIAGALMPVRALPHDATHRENNIAALTVGDRQPRHQAGRVRQPAVGTTPESSVGNALNTALYHTGSGGWYNSPTACDQAHFAKFRLASINPKFRRCPEFLWALYQEKVKRLMHSRPVRAVSAAIAAHATQESLREQRALLAAAPALAGVLQPAESFTGPVPKALKGSRQYWRAAFIQLMAMCIEYGAPQFFLTLTANEMGWVDSRCACGGESHGARPVEATRHYNHRWQSFKAEFLHGKTPLGEITHLWYRQEEQGRGSLHVHAALWVREGSAQPGEIHATAPRGPDFDPTAEQGSAAADPTAGMTAEEKVWRTFILSVQRHDCREGCHWKCGQRVGDHFCKTGYPRRIWTAEELEKRVCRETGEPDPNGEPVRVWRNPETDRYEYRTELPEDERLSPYLPLWSLAWGANMNIQFCTAAGFLGYISKYVPKPEPSGTVEDTVDLRVRENRHVRRVRYLNSRKVGAPECVFDLLQMKMKEGETIVHLETRPPDVRRRCLRRRQPALDGNGDGGGGAAAAAGAGPQQMQFHQAMPQQQLTGLRFYDGLIEKYMKRPVGVALVPAAGGGSEPLNFEALTYPECWKRLDYMRYSDIGVRARERNHLWPAADGDDMRAMGVEPRADSMWWVLRAKPMPVWYDWKLPSVHQEGYYYQKLLLNVPFRDSCEPRHFITPPPAPGEAVTAQNANGNASGSLREECVLRGLVNSDDATVTVAADAQGRHFTPEQIARMLAAEAEFQTTTEAHVLNELTAWEEDHVDPAAVNAPTVRPPPVGEGLYERLDSANLPPAPNVDEATGIWAEARSDGRVRHVQLNREQLAAYLHLKGAGDLQLLAYVGGPAGTGKSTLIRLLTAYWRSQGLNVLLTAASGKAARLIGGHTVHHAFKLSEHTGAQQQSVLAGMHGSRHFHDLACADIIVIDEISSMRQGERAPSPAGLLDARKAAL